MYGGPQHDRHAHTEFSKWLQVIQGLYILSVLGMYQHLYTSRNKWINHPAMAITGPVVNEPYPSEKWWSSSMGRIIPIYEMEK